MRFVNFWNKGEEKCGYTLYDERMFVESWAELRHEENVLGVVKNDSVL